MSATNSFVHLPSEALQEEGLAALALVHVRQLGGRVFGLRRRAVDPHKHPDIEVDAEGNHLYTRRVYGISSTQRVLKDALGYRSSESSQFEWIEH